MSEEDRAAPEAVANAPSESQNSQDQTTKAPEANAEEELAETWPDAEPEESEEAEAETDDDGKDEDGKPRKKSRSERLRSQNERLKAENAQLRSGSAVSAVQDDASIEAVVNARIGEPPKEADFADWFEFQTAKTAYDLDKRQVTRQVKEGAEQAQQAQGARVQELLDDYQEHCEDTAKTIPDFFKVVQSPTFKTTDLVKRLILDAGEKAPLVAYHLAKNPKLAASINAMPPIEAAREMGRIEGRVSVPKPKTATSATPPLSSVKGGASPSRGLGKSMSDYERWRNS